LSEQVSSFPVISQSMEISKRSQTSCCAVCCCQRIYGPSKILYPCSVNNFGKR
jgi:hypothetical protein